MGWAFLCPLTLDLLRAMALGFEGLDGLEGLLFLFRDMPLGALPPRGDERRVLQGLMLLVSPISGPPFWVMSSSYPHGQDILASVD